MYEDTKGHVGLSYLLHLLSSQNLHISGMKIGSQFMTADKSGNTFA